MEILDLYYNRKRLEIEDKEQLEKDEIIKNDEIQKILLKAEEEINEIMESEDSPYKTITPIFHSMYTKNTEKRINEIRLKYAKEYATLTTERMEIEALFNLTDDYTERMKILKNYGIINKNGKIS